uniref:Polyketide synthase n=1 Tax=Cladosporium phlei TaxID=1116209 RepID=J7H687_9PEZI|nr:polyketide synthase [Cladosporium phlei]
MGFGYTQARYDVPNPSSPPSSLESDTKSVYMQDPIAVVGLANRLPGHSNNPTKLWQFLLRGGVAKNDPPESRFGLTGHYDGSHKPHTFKTPGAMFLEDHDPADFDPAFFRTTVADAIAMDPQQRMLLEVVYEALENAGISLSQIDGEAFGCFVGSYAVDYMDMQMRDPEDRAEGITVGAGRAILSNRISHFLNIKGASMTIDTACSGSLVSVDVACRYIQTGQIEGAIVAGANLYMSPDQNMDMGPMRTTASASGRCHTFDAKADGYCKSEAINCVILKHLDAALRDGDPIRAVIRGTATNSDGWTPGIASPAAEAQAVAIRAAYAAAGITNFHETGYLECHGTGTLAGDPVEVAAAASVLTQGRTDSNPLIIGSIKSNIGHSEPAAGVSGLIKGILAVEKNRIPGNPTFIDPNPKIDFKGLRVEASRMSRGWPNPKKRIASVNSFGYGGSNAHVVLQDAESYLGDRSLAHIASFVDEYTGSLFDEDDEEVSDNTALARPNVFVMSANDELSLKSYYKALRRHLIDPSVKIKPSDLAYTLSERRSHLFHRGFVVADILDLQEDALITGKQSSPPPKIGFIFTGQSAQWPQMGRGLIDAYSGARPLLAGLDKALQALPEPPSWSIIDELYDPRTPDHLRLPEFSQPLVTALQLVLVSALSEWGITPSSVVGHSSGEIAGAYAAGFLTAEDAIKIAFFRGEAAKQLQQAQSEAVGMLAVGIGAEEVIPYIGELSATVQIACYNSAKSVTLSGKASDLEIVKTRLQADSHFARALQVNLAYHSTYMTAIGERYQELVERNTGKPLPGNSNVTMYSSVTGGANSDLKDSLYWRTNMVSPVLFNDATTELLKAENPATLMIELGPSGALAGPFSQIKNALPEHGAGVQYFAAAKRGPDSVRSLFEVAGRVFAAGGDVNIRKVNTDERLVDTADPAIIVDLPNYSWNHSKQYWHESDASKEWRYRKYVHHDLLGSKVLGTPWSAPTFSKILDLKDLPWLKDHKMGNDIVFPAAGFCAMAIEALYQSTQVTAPTEGVVSANQLNYRLRNVTFDNALVLEESTPAKIKTTLAPSTTGSHGPWYHFSVATYSDGVSREHSAGLIRLENVEPPIVTDHTANPLQQTTSGKLWYKAMATAGYGFGPLFQKQLEVEATSGQRASRSLVDLTEPDSTWGKQSPYPLHPAALDGIFQTLRISLVAGIRPNIKSVLIPAIMDDLVVFANTSRPDRGISRTTSEYVGKGRRDDNKNYLSNATVHHPDTKKVILQLSGLRCHRLDTGFDPLGAHTFSKLSWKRDVTFLSQLSISPGDFSVTADDLLDLVAHRKPVLRVLEINLDAGDTESVWFGNGNNATRAAYRGYKFASADAAALVNAQARYEFHRATDFALLDLAKPLADHHHAEHDVVICKGSNLTLELATQALRNAKLLLAVGGHAVFLQGTVETVSSVGHIAPPLEADLTSAIESAGLKILTQYVFNEGQRITVSTLEDASSSANATSVKLFSFAGPTNLSTTIMEVLNKLGHNISVSDGAQLSHRETVLVLDELTESLLTRIDAKQWDVLQLLLSSRAKIVWVTHGSQLDVTNPQGALIHGLLRTIRSEDPGLSLTTLDVGDPVSSQTVSAISVLLRRLASSEPGIPIDTEYAERHGEIYISRVSPDEKINMFKNNESLNGALQDGSLRDQKTLVRLRAERIGTLDGLVFGEITSDELPVEPNHVEVDIYAAGLNFKDVAVTMGIVPENEHLLGIEGAGVVRRIASDVTTYKPGDRVVVLQTGTFANRIQASADRTHKIPDQLSYSDAATIPCVYLTSLYGLFNLAGLQKGNSVLIHSAAGGVGISAIKLAQYKQAEIFVTVGTEDKRRFLESEFGIPRSRMFSSRSTAFAKEILAATGGRGIDVILNSLTGELLDETWRICADGGTMVEIGKRDILDRKQLAMEPFDRNCSYRALDFSHKQISDALVADLLSTIFDLYDQGHVEPIRPIKQFSFADIPSAFAYMRGGKHIGKIVVADAPEDQVIVPIRRAGKQVTLQPEASYIIVGGLKGLCGSLAIAMAQRGAKHLIVMSRSGVSDQRSQSIVKDCASYGCRIYDSRGDVANIEDVKAAFSSGPYPVRGIIQGAMVLRDKPFEVMTVEDYHTTISSRVDGTLHLHNIAKDRGIELEFFTLLSSISGVLGQKAQANYAAANVFMDAFANFRNTLGLRANSVDLGVIEDVGYVAEQEGLAQRLDDKQWTGISEAVLLKILDFSILQQVDPINTNSRSQLITGIPVPQPEDSDLARDARFSSLFIPQDANSAGASSTKSDIGKEIQAFAVLLKSGAEDAALLPLVIDIVNKQLTKTLRLSEPIEPAKSLSAYGLDSLASVELRNWVRHELKAGLTTLEINSAPSLTALCEKILSKLKASG